MGGTGDHAFYGYNFDVTSGVLNCACGGHITRVRQEGAAKQTCMHPSSYGVTAPL